jgi:gluconokinase
MSNVLDEIVESYEPFPELYSTIGKSERPVLLTLDIGTSGVRVALFDATGEECSDGGVRMNYATNALAESGVADADVLVDHIAETIDTLLARCESQNEIELVAISCFWHSLVGIDAAGKPTTIVSGWSDLRAAAEAEELQNTLDENKFHSLTGCRFHSSYWPAKLIRLQREEPQRFRATERWLSFSEYLTQQFFSDATMSVSMASGTGLMNQRSCEWEHGLLSIVQLDARRLPEIARGYETRGRLKEKYAQRWPQLHNAHLFPAIGDGAANNIGSGCNSNERVALMIGTSGAMRLLYEGEPPENIPSGLWCYRVDRRRVIIGGALSDGGNLYDWFRGSMLADWDAESIEQQLECLDPDAHGLTFLPFWTGERSTGWSPKARGAIVGITLQTRPIEILRAAMEAVAYRFVQISRALDPLASQARIVASGYALESSRVWPQIIADVLGRPVLLSNAKEASTRGAALLALEAAGKIPGIEEFSFPAERCFEPNMSHHLRYQIGLKRHEVMYDQFQKVGW